MSGKFNVPSAKYVLGKRRVALPVALFLIAVIIPAHFYAGGLLLTSVRFVLLLSLIPILIKLFQGKFGRVIPTDILFVIHIGWMAVSLSVNNRDLLVSQIGSVGLEFIGGYFLARAYIRTAEDFIAMAKFFLFLVCISVPMALHESLTGRPAMIEALWRMPFFVTEKIVTIDGRLGLERAQVAFGTPIHYGLFCSVAFSLTLVGLKDIISDMGRWVFALIIGTGVFLSLSSGALLPVFMQFFLVMWYWIFRNLRSRWIILLSIVAVVYVAIDLASNRTPLKVFFTYATFSAHNAYWRSIIFEWGMKNVWANPWVGLGLNDWVRPWYMYSGSMDNFWLVIAVRNGIPGFLMLAVGYALVMFQVMRVNLEHNIMLARLRLAWVITFISLTFTLCTVHVWSSVYSFVFFLFGAGVWLFTSDLPGDTEDTPETTAPNPRNIGYSRQTTSAMARDHTPHSTQEQPVAHDDAGQTEETVRFSRFAPARTRASRKSSNPGAGKKTGSRPRK
ncbi:O-antigen ligase family protein [Arenibacterium sp. CAU 1754]